MKKTILLELNVTDEELDILLKKLKTAETSFKEVEDAGVKSSERYSGAIKKSNLLVEELDKRTNGLVNSLLDIGDAAKKAGISMRSALVATGVGALVVALGVVVAYWDEIKGFISGANLELERQLRIQQELVDEQEHALALLNSSDNILKLQGKSQAEINKLKQEEIDKLIEIQTRELELQKNRLKSLEEIREGGSKGLEGFFRFGAIVLTSFAEQVDNLFSKIGLSTGLATTTFTASDSIIESIFGSKEDIKETEDAIKALELSLASLQNTSAGVTLENSQGRATQTSIGDGGLTEAGALEVSSLQALNDAKLASDMDYQRALTDLEDLNARARTEIAKLESQAKIQAAMNYANALSGISSLIGRETVAGKALAVASAGISTYLSAQQAYQSQLSIPTPDAPIRAALAAGAAVVAGLANIKRIVSVKVPGGTGGVSSISGGSSFSGGSIPSPQFNVVGDTGINQLQNVIGDAFSKPQRSYVLFSDIEKGQDIERNSIEGATV